MRLRLRGRSWRRGKVSPPGHRCFQPHIYHVGGEVMFKANLFLSIFVLRTAEANLIPLRDESQ